MTTSVYPNASIDGDVSTSWVAAPTAVPGGASWSGWEAGDRSSAHVVGYPWLGVRAVPDTRLLCVRLLQSNALESSTSSFVVQRWNGSEWVNHREVIAGFGTLDVWY